MSSFSNKPDYAVAYLLNLFDPKCEFPQEIIPGFTLRSATDRERNFISQQMHRTGIGYEWPAGHYEMRLNFSQGVGMCREPNKEKWRYYVIEYPILEDDAFRRKTDPSVRMTNFEPAALVSNARFLWGFESPANPQEGILKCCTPDIIHTFHDYLQATLMRNKEIPTLTLDQVSDIKKLFEALENLTEEQDLITRACKHYRASYAFNVRASFRVLALFTAIEFLVTHKPSQTEAGDSLTRQIKGKLPLLCHRFTEPYPPEQFFPDAGKKAWDILYAYRSAIAHGSAINFDHPFKKEGFKELKSSLDVFFFLEEFTRRLLRHAIIEPQLCMDLKRC